MIFLGPLFKISDFFIGSICFITLLLIMGASVRRNKDAFNKGIYLKAFYLKMFYCLAYAYTVSYYYGYGDTEMYFFSVKYMREAVSDDFNNFWQILSSESIDGNSPLVGYFLFRDTIYPVFEAMHSQANFMVPKLALPFALIFGDSYISIAMCFGFFALSGAIRLYKYFTYYFPLYRREVAFAVLFLPSVGFWSSGLLKDTICFGCIGFLLYGLLNVFIKKQMFISSLIWIFLSCYLLYIIKVYILLALAPAIIIWIFVEINKVTANKNVRRAMTLFLLSAGALAGLLLINYLTSENSLKKFSLDTIGESSEFQRGLYEKTAAGSSGSFYTIGSTNPVILFLNGIVATFFRPFPWEINGLTALFSSLEALLFLYLTSITILKGGLKLAYRGILNNGVLLMCFVFSIIFAAAIGSTALNFGTLSRYKIPCLPFYMVLIFVLFRKAKLVYPKWFNNLLGYKNSIRKIKNIPS